MSRKCVLNLVVASCLAACAESEPRLSGVLEKPLARSEESRQSNQPWDAAYRRGDYATALKLVRPHAERGNPKAQNVLGLMYRFGKGVPQNYQEAAKWYRKAADQGHRSAQRNLGNRYRVGKGVPQDYDEAIKWYRRAASQRDAQAEFYLGFMHERAQGVTRDGVEALKWYRRAADRGDAKAQTRLGLMYAEGQGVSQDYSRAADWARKATEQGHEPARQLLDSIAAVSKEGGPKSSLVSSKPREGGDYVFKTEYGQTVIPLPTGEWRAMVDKLSHEMMDMGWFAESWTSRTIVLVRATGTRVTGIISLWVNNSMLWGEGGIVPTDFCYTAQPNWKVHKQVSALPKDTFCWGVRYVRFPKIFPEGHWQEAMQKMTAAGKVPPLGNVATHVRFFRSNVDQILWVDYYIIGTKRAPAWSWQAGRDWAEALVPRILAGFEGKRPKK